MFVSKDGAKLGTAYTLRDFSRGCKNDALKNLIDFPSEVLSQSAFLKGLMKENRVFTL